MDSNIWYEYKNSYTNNYKKNWKVLTYESEYHFTDYLRILNKSINF